MGVTTGQLRAERNLDLAGRMVLALYLQGTATYRTIAEVVNEELDLKPKDATFLTASDVYKHIQRFARNRHEKLDEYDMMRRTLIYDEILDTLYQIKDGHMARFERVAHARVAMHAIDRITKLLGLNAPEQINVQTDQQMEVVVNVKGMQPGTAQEAAAQPAETIDAEATPVPSNMEVPIKLPSITSKDRPAGAMYTGG